MAVEMMGGDEKKKNKKKDSSFHDFLGMSCGSDSPWAGRGGRDVGERAVSAARETGEASVSAASSGARGVAPTGSDFHSGRKRSYSDSSFMGLPKERLLPVTADSPDWPRIMKSYGKEVIDERPRRSPHEDEMALSVPPPSKQNSVSLHPAAGSRQDPVYSKWERSMNMNAAHMGHHHLSRFSQGGAFMDKNTSCKDANAGTGLVSQTAADEGSRTGMKGSGVLKILNSSSMAMEKNASGVLSSSPKPRNIPQITEPDFSNTSSRHGSASVGRQMTIFYAGQAHVFDDVHPNKADHIMALARSRGGSWSINYSAKSGNHPSSEEKVAPTRENQVSVFTPHFSQDLGGRFQLHNLSPLVQSPVAAIPISSSGTQQSGGIVVRDAGPTIVPETNAEHKRNL